jgi:stearoyl-CoA desaturase (Delta-9 desaturase)
MKTRERKINWTNAIYFSVVPIMCIFTTIHWFNTGAFNWTTVILALVLATFVELSITAGYHRLFAHRTYNAAWPVKLFFLIFGAAGLQGSALQWALDHRDHHNYVDDNEKDPYSIGKGFFWAHMGWLYFKHNDQLKDMEKAGDLMDDKLVVAQFHTWVPMGFFVGYILPGIIALAWGDLFGGIFIAGFLRSVLNHHATFLINSLTHCIGKQTYSDSHSARDNWFTAFLTFGEGYHNYHHEFPSDYRNGVRPWDWDPCKWTIRGLSYIGLTYDLKKISAEIILRKRMHMKEKHMLKKLNKRNFDFFTSSYVDTFEEMKTRADAAFKYLSSLRQEHKKLTSKTHKPAFVQLEVEVLKDQINQATREFRKAIREWNMLRRQVLAYSRAA